MDTLLSYIPELLAAAGAAWGWRERVKRNRAAAAAAAADAARAALVQRLDRVASMAQRFAIVLGSPISDAEKVAMLRELERERKKAGL